MLGLASLPYELLKKIITDLTFDDIVNLGRTCRALAFLHVEESICKAIVQSKIQYSKEALEAISSGNNAKALRRAAKRRDALATATPFVVATVGFCYAFLYCKGVLCYTIDDKVRILDLHQSAKNELVISIPGLLTQALPEIGEKNRGVFLILYYSDNIISCLYKTEGPNSTAWLIAFHLEGVILAAQELESTNKIFVRHNKQYLYYGTHEIGTDGYKKWVITGYKFGTRKWFPQKVHLSDMIGSEIGLTICFEFYEGFFYALSNQTCFQVEEIDWTSFYHCIRFPLNSPGKDLLEKTKNKSMWRRQHLEGPIDGRWTSLCLDINESTGKLRIVEARKEWHGGSGNSQRTCYTTDIVFPEPPKDDGLEFNSQDPESTASLPNVPILRLLTNDDHPHYIEAPIRLPENTHPDGLTQPTLTLVESPIRTYHTSCSTFLDLVNDPDRQDNQCLRLRAGTRRLGPTLVDSSQLLRSPSANLETALAEMYVVPEIAFWPPPQDPNPENRDDEVDKIYRLLNPPSHLGNVMGMADERSLVYVTGRKSDPQALIFVGFDPAIKLEGLKMWGGLHVRGETASSNEKGMKEGESKGEGKEKSAYVDPGEVDRRVRVDHKGKGIENIDTAGVGKASMGRGMAWKEKAMYQDINLGFHFGLIPGQY